MCLQYFSKMNLLAVNLAVLVFLGSRMEPWMPFQKMKPNRMLCAYLIIQLNFSLIGLCLK